MDYPPTSDERLKRGVILTASTLCALASSNTPRDAFVSNKGPDIEIHIFLIGTGLVKDV
jgi:hypothetical protein